MAIIIPQYWNCVENTWSFSLLFWLQYIFYIRFHKIKKINMSKRRGECDEESNKVIYENSYRSLGNNLRTEKDSYKNAYFSVLRALYPPTSSYHGMDCPVVKNSRVPIISCILPINESIKLRMSVGSHNLMIEKKKFLYHQTTRISTSLRSRKWSFHG